MFTRRPKEAMTRSEQLSAQIERARRNGPVYPRLSREALQAIADSLPASRGSLPGQAIRWEGGSLATS